MPEKYENKVNHGIPLNRIKPGEKAKVLGISGGWTGHGRLSGLGFRPGLIVEMVAVHPFRGPVVVRIDNTQIAIGRGLASKVMVELIQAEMLTD